MLFQLISEVAYYIIFSVIFSITLLGTILYHRTKDRTIWHFLGVLYMQSLLFLIGFLFTYVNSSAYEELFAKLSESLALFVTIILSFVITFVIYLTVKYILYLLPLNDRNYRLGKFITAAICLLLLLSVLFIIIILTKGEWAMEAGKNLMSLFGIGSLLLAVPAVLALVYVRKTEVKGNRQLLKGIVFSFLPMPLFFTIDFFFLADSAFKTAHIAYAVFAVSVYMYLTKHYTINYEPETGAIMSYAEKFYKQYSISDREVDIIESLVLGKTNKEIAAELFISINTVKTHIKNIYRKLGVKNRVQLMHKIKLTDADTPNG
ncbi:MAG: helix-turn-helix transcriptional regulator [Clostridia bacterium]